MEVILGIDLGTTNSAVSMIQDGRPIVLKDEQSEGILPSVVGLDSEGKLLVGHPARNQAVLAPERTVASIKRKMGQDTHVSLGDKQYTPQEISAIILRTLKERAALVLGCEVRKAVITVPAFFSERQRDLTREAGELAGLEVVRIINEPTAATLTYEPPTQRRERLLVYDLGGGTFDVSIVQIEQGVVEVLASHGDTHLGGDDFDQLLLDYLCDYFEQQHGLDLRTIPVAKSRLLRAAEDAKKRLSSEVFVRVTEEFLAEKDGVPLHLDFELARRDYEDLIQTLLDKTVHCVDSALADAKLVASQIDKVILVGGSSRTPLVHRLLREQLQQEPHLEIDPDLCVAMGAAVQGAMIAGIEVGPVLVDITPHTLGIRAITDRHGLELPYYFSPVIPRNTPLPAVRSELYFTTHPGQPVVKIAVYQGEHEDVRNNHLVGEFSLDQLAQTDDLGEILVRFELNLDGLLTVTAVERATSKEKKLTIDNAITRFRSKNREEAHAKLAEMFHDHNILDAITPQQNAFVRNVPGQSDEEDEFSNEYDLMVKARRLIAGASREDAVEINLLTENLDTAIQQGNRKEIEAIRSQLEDIMFYLEDA